MAVPENWRVKLKKTEIFTEIVEYDNDNHKEQPQNDKKKSQSWLQALRII